MVKTLLFKSEIVGSIPTPQVKRLVMLDSSNRYRKYPSQG